MVNIIDIYNETEYEKIMQKRYYCLQKTKEALEEKNFYMASFFKNAADGYLLKSRKIKLEEF